MSAAKIKNAADLNSLQRAGAPVIGCQRKKQEVKRDGIGQFCYCALNGENQFFKMKCGLLFKSYQQLFI